MLYFLNLTCLINMSWTFVILVTYFFSHQILITVVIIIIYLWSVTSYQADWKNMFKIINQKYFVTLNMFCFLFSSNIIEFFLLYFHHWYVLYVHNLKQVHVQPPLTLCQKRSFLCFVILEHILYSGWACTCFKLCM